MSAVLAIIPVFIIILSGYICRHFKLVGKDFWSGAEKLSYFLLFPCLLFSKMAVADLSEIDFVRPIMVILLIFLIITALFIAVKSMLGLTNSAFTSVYQGGIRFNTYIGLAVINSLYGPEGLVKGVIIAALMIPTINTCCVVLLECYNDKQDSKPVIRVIKSVLRNPLILACVLGMTVNLTGLQLPMVFLDTLFIFARAALPLGLLVVGAALVLNEIQASIQPVMIASVSKFLILPTVAMVLCQIFALDLMVANIILVLTTLPTATASYVLAKQLGGDYELMATIITAQTLLACMMIPLMLFVFQNLFLS